MERRVVVVRVACLCASLVRLAMPDALGAQHAARLDDVVAIALRQNPDLLIARLRADSAGAERRIARAIPNPVLNSAPNQPWQYTVTMPLDLTPVRLYRTRAADRGADAARTDIDDLGRQVRFAVRQAFYDVLMAEQRRDLAAEREDILRQILAADSARLRGGDIPRREVTKTELEFARAQADRLGAVAAVHATRLALQLLMGVESPDTSFAIAGDLSFHALRVPEDSLAALATQLRPDIRAAEHRVAQSEALHREAGSAWVPVPVVTFTHSRGPFDTGDLFSNGTTNAVGFGFTLPLFDWNGGARARSEAGLEQAQVATRQVLARVANELATSLDAYRSSRELAERYESGLLARARDGLETARYAYGTGAISLLELLDAIRTYSDTRADYVSAAHDYWVSVFALSRAVGRDFGP